jgi:hypothetical protein
MWRYPVVIVLGVVAMTTAQTYAWPGTWYGFYAGIAALIITFEIVEIPGRPKQQLRRRVLAMATGLAAGAIVAYMAHRFLGIPA